MKMKRDETYRVKGTGFTITPTYRGFVVECRGREVRTLMSRKSTMAWIKRNACGVKSSGR